MSTKRIAVAILAAGFLLLLATPGHAQIASYVDASGKRVYVNGDSPAPRSGSTIKKPATTAAKPAAPKADLSLSKAAPPDSDPRIERIVDDAAARHQVDPRLVKAVINTESGWNPSAVSRKGAMGLMQLIPGTGRMLRRRQPV